jgi:ABC-2 type transport system permease protein
MGAIFSMSLRQFSGRWRLTLMSVLAALPVFVAIVSVRSAHAPSVEEFEVGVLSTLLAGSIAPLVVLAIASVAFGNEVEDRTLANLTLAPIPRWQIVVPKLLAAITVSGPFVVVSAYLTSQVAFNADMRASFAVTVSALVGVLMYSSAFVWLGLVTTQAIGVGLAYIVLWEGFFGGFVANIRLLSIRHYSIALMHGLDERRFASADHVSFLMSIVASVALVGAFLWLSVRRLRVMDVP